MNDFTFTAPFNDSLEVYIFDRYLKPSFYTKDLNLKIEKFKARETFPCKDWVLKDWQRKASSHCVYCLSRHATYIYSYLLIAKKDIAVTIQGWQRFFPASPLPSLVSLQFVISRCNVSLAVFLSHHRPVFLL